MNIFSKTPRPGRPESTPPNGTPSFFSKFSNRLCPSGKKVRHEDEIDIACGYRSDDNLLRCPPVKQKYIAYMFVFNIQYLILFSLVYGPSSRIRRSPQK